jgi:TolB-like protein
MQLLVYLAVHAGRVISRTELEKEVWEGRVVSEDALTNSISKLRRALDDNARQPSMIETLPKTGYRLIAEVCWSAKAATVPAHDKSHGNSRQGLKWGMAAILLLVTAVALWVASEETKAPSPQEAGATRAVKPTVAIIPFENLSGKTHDYFANGITTNLITEMSRLSGIIVIARGSVFSYANTPAGTRQISRELNADYIVRGAVQRQSEQLRVNVQLIEAKTERALWGGKYEGEMHSLFKLQDQIASALLHAMSISLAPGEQKIFSQYPTTSVAAYDLFLRGQEEYGHRNRHANRAAREYFEQAIELDPQFARATAGLALVYSREAIDGWTNTPDQSLKLAAEFADKAARINPTIPQVYFVAGQVALFRQQHDVAITAVENAITYAPNYADAYALLAWILNYAGETARAMEALQTAHRLNPIMPASYHQLQGEINYLQGYYTDAIKAFNTTLQINPTHMRARMWLIATLIQNDMSEEAQWEAHQLLLNHPEFSTGRLQYAFPFRDKSIRQQLISKLRQAGLPG